MKVCFQLQWSLSSSDPSSPGVVNTEEWWDSLELKAVDTGRWKWSQFLRLRLIHGSLLLAEDHNTEHQKKSSVSGLELTGCPKKLAEAIRRDEYNPLLLPNEKLRQLCRTCTIKERGLSKVFRVHMKLNQAEILKCDVGLALTYVVNVGSLPHHPLTILT